MRDPVCGVEVDTLRARSVGIFGGRTFYFCSPEHKAEFSRDPAGYLARGGLPQPIVAEPTGRSRKKASPPTGQPVVAGSAPSLQFEVVESFSGAVSSRSDSGSMQVPHTRTRLFLVLGALIGASVAALAWALR